MNARSLAATFSICTASLFGGLAGCSEADTLTDAGVDGGAADATGIRDATTAFDATARDASSEDGGTPVGHTIIAGKQQIAGGLTYVDLEGTLTSTMPPLVVVGTGLHLGGIPGPRHGAVGGGIGHEYLPGKLEFLLPGRLILYFDLYGTGRSGIGPVETSTLSAEAHIEQIGVLVDWLDAMPSVDASTVDLFGHGYGAGIAARFAALYPSRVDRLVLVAPMALRMSDFTNTNIELQERLSNDDRFRLENILSDIGCRRNQNECSIDVWNVIAAQTVCAGHEEQLAAELSFRYADFRTYAQVRYWLVLHPYDWADELPRVSARTMIVSGSCDVIPANVARTYTASIAGARHEVLEGSGHFPMIEEPAAFRAAVGALLIRR